MPAQGDQLLTGHLPSGHYVPRLKPRGHYARPQETNPFRPGITGGHFCRDPFHDAPGIGVAGAPAVAYSKGPRKDLRSPRGLASES